MKSNRNPSKKVNNNTGLSVIFSEKALITLLHVILALGIAHLQFSTSTNQEHPAKVLQNKHN
ncbi:hypothetical protein [Dendronalium phyllosphericum]|uniref:hypothetical protein n=1 Tax=Dendronalium phyllosphericum TaxID=2840445 RepID=UPI001BDC6241|nr:hypothetical protein [Dendronalium phyllosphericum]